MDKDKWKKIFVPDIVSSEESDSGNEDNIVVKSLAWRSERVNKMFHLLDEEIEKGKTTQARRQKRQRVIGTEASTRQAPTDFPDWAVHVAID